MTSAIYAVRVAGHQLTPAFEKRSWYWALFLASYFFLLGFPRLFSLPAAILLLVGIYQSVALLRARRIVGVPAAYWLYCLAFLLLWLPLLFSLTDAAYAGEAASDTFKILSYGFVGIATVWLVRERQVLHPLVIILVALALFWTADVIFQRLVGFDVFGRLYSHEAEARGGAYFKNPAKFGTYLACMDILALYYLAPRMASVWRLLAIWCFLLLGMLFSMSRTGWAIFLMLSSPLLLLHFIRQVRYAWLWLLLMPVLIAPMLYGFYQHDPVLQTRMARSLAFMNGMTYDNWNTVLTYRLDLWRAALQMIGDHWLNGQGLHAFTSDFSRYPASSFWQGVQPSHEHQYLLQVMVATGVWGLAGIIALHVLILAWAYRHRDKATVALPVGMYLLAMWFPVSSHFSFYSSEWVWANLMLLGLLIAGLEQSAQSQPSAYLQRQ